MEEKSLPPPRLIATGSRACVFSPALNTEESQLLPQYATPNYVSKVVLSKEQIISEIIVRKRLEERKLQFGKYLILVEGYKAQKIAVTPELAACFANIHPHKTLSTQQFAYNAILRHGGETLIEYAALTTNFSEFIRIFRVLLQILQQLHQAHVFHMDLKEQNILLKQNEKPLPVPRLIDFGNSLIDELPADYAKIYQDPYINHPLFLNLLTFYHSGNSKRLPSLTAEMHSMYDHDAWKVMGGAEGNQAGQIWKTARTLETDSVSMACNRRRKYGEATYRKQIINPNLRKVDAYMLAYAFINNLDYHEARYSETTIPARKIVRFVLGQMLAPNVFSQWDETQALEYLDEHLPKVK